MRERQELNRYIQVPEDKVVINLLLETKSVEQVLDGIRLYKSILNSVNLRARWEILGVIRINQLQRMG